MSPILFIEKEKIMIEYDIIVVSDVHLGTKNSQAKHLTEMLKSLKFKKLILLGDIFQDLNFDRLSKHHWKFLSYIRSISDGKEVIWVLGNHDYKLSHIMSHLVGIETFDEYISNNTIFIHGHQFTPFKNYNRFIKILLDIYIIIQKVLPCKLILKLEHIESKILNSRSKVKTGAIKYATNKRIKNIVCGHTHKSETYIDGDISYYNTGCWTDESNMTYISIKDDKISIKNYKEEPKGVVSSLENYDVE